MAVKEAEEDDLLDDDNDNADAESTSSGASDRRSKLSAESSKSQHKCSRKPTVSHVLFLHPVLLVSVEFAMLTVKF